MSHDIFVAKASFFFDDDGVSVLVPKGATVRAGHPMLSSRDDDMFAPMVVDFEHEAPRRGPGRPRKTVEGGE